MDLYCGTSGFAYKQWKGPFYPEDLPAARMLAHYASRLNSVEINNTFYRMPKKATIEAWREQVSSPFRFAIKASRRISHFKRLKNCEPEAGFLFEAVAELGPNLGAVLVQLPPNMRLDLARLEAFLTLIPHDVRAAFEFRHDSWDVAEVDALLVQANATRVTVDTAAASPPTTSAPGRWAYLRLRAPDYSDQVLEEWAAYCQSFEQTFVFFKHEEDGQAPALAERLARLNAACID